jgi:cell division protein FtsW (lipid II flippase)
VLIIPSLGVPNWSVIYIINTTPSSKFSGAVAGEKEDFCKRSLARTIFYFVFSFALLYFCLYLFIKNTKKLVSFLVAFIYLLLVLLEWVLLKTPSSVTLLVPKK